MLTEIEWWGGVLIVWMVLMYGILFKELRRESKLDMSMLPTSTAFFSSIAVLALYFYVLESQLAQLIYTGVVILGAVSTVVMFFWPSSEAADEAAQADEGADVADEGGDVVGQIILFFPIVVSLGFASYKTLTLFELIPSNP